jgi:hypothetical protein
MRRRGCRTGKPEDPQIELAEGEKLLSTHPTIAKAVRALDEAVQGELKGIEQRANPVVRRRIETRRRTQARDHISFWGGVRFSSQARYSQLCSHLIHRSVLDLGAEAVVV